MTTMHRIRTLLATTATPAIVAAVLALGATASAQPAPTEVAQPTPTEVAQPTAAETAQPTAAEVAQPTEAEAAPPIEAAPHGQVPDAEHQRLADEAAGDAAELEGKGTAPAAHHEEAAHGGGHGDPSQHFNFFNFSYRGKDAYGGKYGDGKMVDPHTGAVLTEEEPMSAPFVLMVVNFLILLGILVWKGGPIAGKLATERHDQIKNALDEAAKLRQEAQDKLAEYQQRLADADAEIAKLVDGMRKDAEADKARILESAEKQSAQMKRDAELRIAAEIERARAALTREVTAASALATEKLLREKMMPGDQQQLVAAFIGDVQATAVSAKERV